MATIQLEDNEAFTVAEGMAIGTVDATGNLRMIVTEPGGVEKAIELPHKWLKGQGGLEHWLRENVPMNEPRKVSP